MTHFAIHADDTERARTFYETVFGWNCRGYGPPDFLQIFGDEDSDLMGAIASREYNVSPAEVTGFECTVSVSDIDAIAEAVQAQGGAILMPKTAIPGVGWIIKFLDTERNLVCAMQDDPDAE